MLQAQDLEQASQDQGLVQLAQLEQLKEQHTVQQDLDLIQAMDQDQAQELALGALDMDKLALHLEQGL